MHHEEHVPGLDDLVDLLSQVVREQVGEILAETMNRIRRLAFELRAGIAEAEDRLVAEISRLSPSELRSVIRWLSLYFDLANLVEDHHRIRILHQRALEAKQKGLPPPESLAEAIYSLKNEGCAPGEIQEWLDCLWIQPVFTAHPSEAKRRTMRQLLRRLREHLPLLEEGPEYRDLEAVLSDLTILWQTDSLRPSPPGVMNEVERGLYFAESLWRVVPAIYRELRSALRENYPHHTFEIKPFLSFGTWIGGDRDGHPFVTADVTRETLSLLRKTALRKHLERCRELLTVLVVSHRQAEASPLLYERLEEHLIRWPILAHRLEPYSPYEIHRRWLKMIEYRLENSLDLLEEGDMAAGYERPAEMLEDLDQLRQSMLEHKGERVFQRYLQPWIDLLLTFGFHFASLDIRQDSDSHRKCLFEIQTGQAPGGGLSEEEKKIGEEALAEMEVFPDMANRTVSDSTQEMLDTFDLLAETFSKRGHFPLGGYIISMTHSVADVLAVLRFWNHAWKSLHPDRDLPHLPIIPLFETIEDLERAPIIMEDLFTNPVYREYLDKNSQPFQVVMVGYSDSTKDGGYLTSAWNLHAAQEKIAQVCSRHHVELTVFHGRGGSLGRGGGPAARAIRSLPRESVQGRLRLTEQGEVLAERYDNPAIAHRHLEQLTHATLMVSAHEAFDLPAEWREAMNRMSRRAFAKYRELVEHPDFLHYFDRATPISEIESLPIGSRPARRRARRSLSDLRAIPWTFAWTQSRHLIPAWYGLGTAILDHVDAQEKDWAVVQDMYRDWPVFQAIIDNAELALSKADLGIMHRYAELAGDAGEPLWRMISEEFRRASGSICLITGQHELLETVDWLSRSIRSRNPYVDPLNLIQMHLLREVRGKEEALTNQEIREYKDLIRLSIQGIASGLRTTG